VTTFLSEFRFEASSEVGSLHVRCTETDQPSGVRDCTPERTDQIIDSGAIDFCEFVELDSHARRREFIAR
jgi:hypothetical protein